jgi:hypothetical protein
VHLPAAMPQNAAPILVHLGILVELNMLISNGTHDVFLTGAKYLLMQREHGN